MNINEFIGQKIKQNRQKQNYSQEFLANQVGISVGYLKRIELGSARIKFLLFSKILKLLRTTPYKFFEDFEEM